MSFCTPEATHIFSAKMAVFLCIILYLTSRLLTRSLVSINSKLGLGVVSFNQGPVVQSIVSLTSSLSGQLVKCSMTL